MELCTKASGVQSVCAWCNEFFDFSLALIQEVQKELSESFVASAYRDERIIKNAGKQFSEDEAVAFGGGVLAVIGRFEQLLQTMDREIFSELYWLDPCQRTRQQATELHYILSCIFRSSCESIFFN